MPDLIILFTYPFLPPTAPKKECMIKKSKMHFFSKNIKSMTPPESFRRDF